MIKPSPDLLRAVATMATHNPVFVEWLQAWRQHELEKLPNAGTETVAILQGRCQVLTELCKLVHDAPELVAQSPRRG